MVFSKSSRRETIFDRVKKIHIFQDGQLPLPKFASPKKVRRGGGFNILPMINKIKIKIGGVKALSLSNEMKLDFQVQEAKMKLIPWSQKRILDHDIQFASWNFTLILKFKSHGPVYLVPI